MRRAVIAGLAAFIGFAPAAARAEISLFDKNGFHLGANVDAGAAFIATKDTNFGAGAAGDDKADWAESHLRAGLAASYDLGKGETLYGNWTLIGTANFGGPDAEGWNEDNPRRIDQDLLFAGWRSGDLFPSLGKDAVDLSFGQQNFSIGDGFLVWDGNSGGDAEGNYWFAAKRSFNRAGLLRFNTTPVRGDFFYLRSDPDAGDTQALGVNLEFSTGKAFTIGSMYMLLYESDFDSRKDLNVFDLRVASCPIENLTLTGEVVWERNGESDAEVKAFAWYGEATYTLAKLPWSPSVTYRFSVFSGDDVDTRDNGAFDPLFYGIGRGWGTWVQGEIVGEYLLFNSNERAHMLAIRAQPLESLAIGLLGFRFDLDKDNYYGTPVDSTHFADEVNLYADWTVTKNIYVGAIAGMAWPGDAAENLFGDDQPYGLFEMLATITF